MNSSMLSYKLVEIRKTIRNEPPYSNRFGFQILSDLRKELNEHKNQLLKNEILSAKTENFLLSKLDHTLERMLIYFKSPKDSNLNEKDMFIFLDSLQLSIDELMNYKSFMN